MIGDIVVRIRGDARSYSAAMKQSRQQTGMFRRSVVSDNRRVSGSFNTVERSVFKLRARMIGLRAVAGGFTGFFAGRGIVGYADQWKLATSRIATVTGSMESAKVEMREILALSNRSRGSINNLANSYAKLRLSRDDLSKQTTFDFLETLQKSLVIGGNTNQETASVLLQSIQGIAADQLGGEELRTIRESGFYFQKILAEGLGITVGEIKQYGADAKLTAKAVTDAVTKMASKVNSEFDKIPLTVGQASVKLSNNFREWVGTFDSASGATSYLAGSIDLLGDNIGSVISNGSMIVLAGGALLISRSFGNASQTLLKNAAAAIKTQSALRATGKVAVVSASKQVSAYRNQRRAAIQYQSQILSGNVAFQSARTQSLALLQVRRQIAVANTGLIASERALAVAVAQTSLRMRAGALAASAARGALAFVGGPIGLGILAISAGFAMWAKNARKAAAETRLLSEATDRISAISNAVEGDGYIQTFDMQAKSLTDLQEKASIYKARLGAIKKELKGLDRQSEGYTKQESIGSGYAGRTQSVQVSGVALDDNQIRTYTALITEMGGRRADLAEVERVSQVITDKGIVGLEEYNRVMRERGKVTTTNQAIQDKYNSAMEALASNVEKARFNFQSFGKSGEALNKLLVQSEVNKLIAEGVVVTDNMRLAITERVREEQELIGSLTTAKEIEKTRQESLKNAISLVKSFRTPLEVYHEALKKINKQRADNPDIVNTLTFERARADAAKTYADALEAARIAAGGIARLTVQDARSFAESHLTPLQAYRKEWERIKTMRESFPAIVTEQAAWDARVQAAKQYSNALKAARNESRKMSENLAQSLVYADSLGDAVKNFGAIIQKALADKFVVKPLTDAIDGFLGKTSLFKANDNTATTELEALGEIASVAGNKLKGGFTSSVTQSASAMILKKAAETASTTAISSEVSARLSSTTSFVTHSAAIQTSITSLLALAVAAKAAAVSVGSKGASEIASKAGAALKFGGGRASGGTVRPGYYYEVNERRQEFISPIGRSAQVLPGLPAAAKNVGGEKTVVHIVPSPYFGAEVDGRAARVAVPISHAASIGTAQLASKAGIMAGRRSLT